MVYYYLLHIILSDVFNSREIQSAAFHFSRGLALHDMRLCDVDFNFHTQLYQVNVFANT